MKYLSMILALCMTIWSCISLTAKNNRVVEHSGLPLADPYVLLENGVYYAYGTHSADGIEVYTSNNLKDWKLEGLALNKMNTNQTRWFWAPEVYHIGNIYYMYYSGNERLYVATSASPLGPFKQAGEQPFLDEGSIDGTLFKDEDGSYYFFFVRFKTDDKIWVAKMRDDMLGIRTETMHPCLRVSQAWETDPLFPGSMVNEGPFVLKRGGTYYLTYSANHYQSKNYGVGVATTRNIMGEWTKQADNPILQNVGNLVGTGHHSFFKDKKGKLQMIFHAHNTETQVHPRFSYFVPTRFYKNTLKVGNKILSPQLKKE